MSVAVPSYVQKQYDRVLSDGLPGANADSNPTRDFSFIAENGDIPFGRVVSLGSSYGPPPRARLGTTSIHAASAGYLIGTGFPIQVLSTWTAITTGEFSIKINGVAHNITALDFHSATDLDGIASVIQTAVRAIGTGGYTLATVVWDDATEQFKITSGTTGTTSSVTYPGVVTGGSGIEINVMLGWDSFQTVVGTAAVVAATILGVSLRSITEEGGAGAASKTTTVREGHVGAFRQDGLIKVLCLEATAGGGSVYFDDATGEIYAASGSGRTQLGSAIYTGTYSVGQVGIIDVKGLR